MNKENNLKLVLSKSNLSIGPVSVISQFSKRYQKEKKSQGDTFKTSDFIKTSRDEVIKKNSPHQNQIFKKIHFSNINLLQIKSLLHLNLTRKEKGIINAFNFNTNLVNSTQIQKCS
jgi:hypothetical protein